MSSWFTTKKVEGSDTLSEKMVEIRTAKKVDLDTLSNETKITKKYLVYMEEGRLDKLPAEIYVKGFLKKIADFYEVDVSEFTRLYKKEDNIRQNIDRSKYPPFNLNSSPTFIITPRTITAFIVSVLLISFMVFFSYQISAIFKGPELVITVPENELVVDFTPVLVEGSIGDKDSTVSINGEVISLKSGKISEEINLVPGSNTIKISAVNRFKRVSEITRIVILKVNDKTNSKEESANVQ